VPICWKQRLMATASQIFPFKLTPTHDKLDKNIGNPNLRMSIMSSLIDGFFCKSIEPSSLSKLIGRRCDDNDTITTVAIRWMIVHVATHSSCSLMTFVFRQALPKLINGVVAENKIGILVSPLL
jgi:hypothetical protein